MMRNLWRLAVLVVSLVLLGALPQPGLAVPTVFFDRDDNTALMTSFPNSLAKFNQFTATLGSFGVDSIDTLPASTFNPTLTFGATGITANTQATLVVNAPTYEIGAQSLVEPETFTPVPAANTVFTFNQYIRSFGLYVIQGGDLGNNNPTTFRLRNTFANTFTDVVQQVGPGWGDNNVFFLGVTDTNPFDQVEIIETNDAADGMLYDNVVAGGAVPEPCSLMLMLLGGACTLCRGTRFRRG